VAGLLIRGKDKVVMTDAIIDDPRDCGPMPEFLVRRAPGPLTPALFENAGVPVSSEPAPRALSNLGCTVQPKSDSVEAGRAAWIRLKGHSTWEDWKAVGIAIAEGRAWSMVKARTNKPEGRRYNEEFGAWLDECGFADLEKATRARLLKCMENRVAIEDFLATLGLGKRLKLNHPVSVWNAYKRETEAPKPKTGAPDWVKVFNQSSAEDRTAGFDHLDLKEFFAAAPAAVRGELERLVLGNAKAHAPTRRQRNAIGKYLELKVNPTNN
jgi:hypothetical protein